MYISILLMYSYYCSQINIVDYNNVPTTHVRVIFFLDFNIKIRKLTFLQWYR